MYNNYNNNYGYNRPRGGYMPRYNRGFGYNNGGYALRPQKKMSGAKFIIDGDKLIVSAWRCSNRQLFVLYARPYKNTKVTTSEKGKQWANLFVTITNRTTMQVTNTSGLLDIDRKRLYIKELNLIATSAGNKGYFGSQFKSNR